MFMKRPNHRVFDYEPRFYDPNKDDKEKRKRKLNFRAGSKVKGKNNFNLIKWGLFLVIVIIAFLKLKGLI